MSFYFPSGISLSWPFCTVSWGKMLCTDISVTSSISTLPLHIYVSYTTASLIWSHYMSLSQSLSLQLSCDYANVREVEFAVLSNLTTVSSHEPEEYDGGNEKSPCYFAMWLLSFSQSSLKCTQCSNDIKISRLATQQFRKCLPFRYFTISFSEFNVLLPSGLVLPYPCYT